MQVGSSQVMPTAAPGVIAGRPNVLAGRSSVTIGRPNVTTGRSTLTTARPNAAPAAPLVMTATPPVMAATRPVMAGLDPAMLRGTNDGRVKSGHDVSDVQPAQTLSEPQIARIHNAAQDFEAMALGQLLAPMFNTVDAAHSAFGGGEAEATIKPLLVDAIAKHIAAHGGLGFAAPVFASMLRTQEAANAAGRGGGQ